MDETEIEFLDCIDCEDCIDFVEPRNERKICFCLCVCVRFERE